MYIRKEVKADFQFVLNTPESLFSVFVSVLCHLGHHKNCNYWYLHEVLKFKVSRQLPLSMQSFILCSFSYHLMKQLPSCKNQ